jgi:hypothetical protein
MPHTYTKLNPDNCNFRSFDIYLECNEVDRGF